jgi:hypothetical protein
MNQNPSRPNQVVAGTGGWSWPRLFRQLGIGPSAASMLALPYLYRFPSPTPTHPQRPSSRP